MKQCAHADDSIAFAGEKHRNLLQISRALKSWRVHFFRNIGARRVACGRPLPAWPGRPKMVHRIIRGISARIPIMM